MCETASRRAWALEPDRHDPSQSRLPLTGPRYSDPRVAFGLVKNHNMTITEPYYLSAVSFWEDPARFERTTAGSTRRHMCDALSLPSAARTTKDHPGESVETGLNGGIVAGATVRPGAYRRLSASRSAGLRAHIIKPVLSAGLIGPVIFQDDVGARRPSGRIIAPMHPRRQMRMRLAAFIADQRDQQIALHRHRTIEPGGFDQPGLIALRQAVEILDRLEDLPKIGLTIFAGPA